MKFKLNTPFVCWNVGEILVNGNMTHHGRQHAGCVLVTAAADLKVIADAYAAPETRPLLVDSDHLSEDPTHHTQAIGWVLELIAQGDELLCNMMLVGDGHRLVEDRVLAYCSPIWILDYVTPDQANAAIPRMRPVRMESLGLTNQPRNKTLPPISSPVDADAPAILHNKQGGKKAALPNNNKPTKPKMIEIAKLLGLDETATEAEIQAKLAEVLSQLADAQASMQNRAKADEDAFFEQNKDVIPQAQTAAFRSLYATSPSGVAGIVAAMRDLKKTAANPAAALLNRTAPIVGAPQAGPGQPPTESPAVAVFRQWDQMPEGAAKQRFYKDNKGSVLEGDRLTRTAAK